MSLLAFPLLSPVPLMGRVGECPCCTQLLAGVNPLRVGGGFSGHTGSASSLQAPGTSGVTQIVISRELLPSFHSCLLLT